MASSSNSRETSAWLDAPLSEGQRALWFLYQMDKNRCAYNMNYIWRVRGEIKVPALRGSLEALVERHPVWRSTFPLIEGEPVQRIHAKMPLQFHEIDAGNWSQEQLQKQLKKEIYEPFDLEKQSPIRWRLFHHNGDVYISWQMHHMVSDVWSCMKVLNELRDLYGAALSGESISFPEVEVSNADYVTWQQDFLKSDDGKKQLEFWKEELGGDLPVLNLQTDYQRPQSPSFRCELYAFPLPATFTDKFNQVASKAGVSLFSLYLSAYQVLLHRYSNQNEVLVGAPTAGRSAKWDLFHYYVNPVVFRARLADNPTFLDFLKHNGESSKTAIANQNYPFPLLVHEVSHEMDPSRSPIYQVSFVWENPNRFENRENKMLAMGEQGEELWHLGDMVWERVPVKLQLDSFDITLKLIKIGSHFQGQLEYNPDLFSPETAQRMAGHFQTLLKSIADNSEMPVAELNILPEAERHKLLVTWNDRKEAYTSDKCIHEYVEDQAAKTPNFPALALGDTKEKPLTYAEMNQRANQLAHYLIKKGIGPGDRVGVSMRRGIEVVISLLGIMKAGGVYVPLDAKYPRDRMSYILEDSAVRFVMSEEKLREETASYGVEPICFDSDGPTIAGESKENPSGRVSADHESYIIYTSGSTGRPKGVVIPHRAISRHTKYIREFYQLNKQDRVLQFSAFTFDASVEHIFPTLTSGAQLVVRGDSLWTTDVFNDAATHHKITIAHLPTAYWQQLIQDWHDGPYRPPKDLCLRYLLAGGDAMQPKTVELFYELGLKSVTLLNSYGPTETTITSGLYEPPAGVSFSRIPIGKTFTNRTAYILDRNGRPMPLGVPGELFFGGIGLAECYQNRKDLTATAFIPDPFSEIPGARMYKTGDLSRFMLDGNIEFLGRVDHQVKIRGFRIELGEIQTTLDKHESVTESIVMARETGRAAGEKHLVAYVLPREGGANASDLRTYLGDKLPDYMVPSAFVIMEEWPMTPTGKVDRKALPQPEAKSEAEFVAPESGLESTIAKIWQEVLGVEKVGIHDKFFDLGGHSLLLVKVRTRLLEIFDRDIQLTDLFAYPTISSLADFLGASHTTEIATRTAARDRAAHGNTDIAVVGLSGRFPGASSAQKFWENIRDGVFAISFFSESELEEAGIDPDLVADPHYVRARGILENYDQFDASFFDFSPREAQILDPQHRLFLEIAWEAIEDAGYDPDRYDGGIGVYAGTAMSTYFVNNLVCNPKLVETVGIFPMTITNDKDGLSTRVAFKLNLRGPAITIQTACSTSLVAIHTACKAIIGGECDMALAGGSSIQIPQKEGYLYMEGGTMSPDGHCRAFDAKAKGMLVSSGLGVVLLKPLDDAVATGDSIYAIIKGSAINNDGSFKVGYTAPSVDGQAACIAEAQAFAGVDPRTIDLIEAHGTGTGLGDPIEMAALGRVFRAKTKDKGFCAIGSVKTNIGHLDSAAGVAGFIKAVMALKHRQMPPSLHYEEPNPQIDFDNSPFFVNTKLRDWNKGDHPRRAGVSAFGIGGTNSHVVLEEAPERPAGGRARSSNIIVLSARSAASLESMSSNLACWLKHHPGANLADVAYTLQVGRKEFSNKRALVCSSVEEAIDILETGDKRLVSSFQEPAKRPVVFMFSGQGSQYVDMGLGLYEDEPEFKKHVDRCADLMEPHLGLDIRSLMYPAPSDDEETNKQRRETLNQTRYTQPSLFIIEYSLAQLWLSWGFQPKAMIGHSIGEYAAACLAGVISLEDAIRIVVVRGRLMQELPPGDMVAVPLNEEEVTPYLVDGTQVATINSPGRCVVAGDPASIENFQKNLEEKAGKKCTMLHTSHAFHSSMMDPMLDPFTTEVASVTLKSPKIPYVSNVSGTWITDAEATDPAYYARHVRNAVRFSEGLQVLADNEPGQVFLEVGPGRTLLTFARQQLRGSDHKVLSSLPHPKPPRDPDISFILASVAQMWLLGQRPDWETFHHGEMRLRISLPTYPFDRRRCWIDPPKRDERVHTRKPSGRKKTDIAEWYYTPLWQQSLPPDTQAMTQLEEIHGPWLIFMDEMGLARKLVERLGALGQKVTTVSAGGHYHRADDHFVIRPAHRDDYSSLMKDLAGMQFVPRNIVHAWSVSGPRQFESKLAYGDRCLERGYYSLIHLVQAMDQQNLSDNMQLSIISNNMQRVAGEDYACPEKATVLGPCRVVPREFPHIVCRSLDFVFAETEAPCPDEVVDRILAELVLGNDDFIVAFRDNQRWVPRFTPYQLKASEGVPSRIREGGTYLITGGLGGIGIAIAQYMAALCKINLVLTRRSSFPERDSWEQILESPEGDRNAQKIQEILDMEANGTRILVCQADATNLEQMQRVVKDARQNFGSIDGVIHAAGMPSTGLIVDETPELSARVLGPKFQGTLVLDTLFGHDDLDFMVLFSSTSAILGNMGFASYCAANSFLDVYAHHRNASSNKLTVAVNWDGWKDIGMAVDMKVAPEHEEQHQKALDELMSTEDGLEAFHRILAGNRFAQSIVSPMDFQGMVAEIQNFLVMNANNLYTESSSESIPMGGEGAANDGSTNQTERVIRELWQESLGLEEIGLDDNFFDMGGDSLLATMITSRIRKLFKVKITPNIINEKPTVAEFSAFIREEVGDDAPAAAPAKPPPEPEAKPATEPEKAEADAGEKKIDEVDANRRKRGHLRTAYLAPRSEVERQMAQLWSDQLNLDKVGIHDDFFDLGGHTQMTEGLTSAICKEFEVELPNHAISYGPTVADLAEKVETIRWASQSIESNNTLSDDDDEEFEL